jgi:hypothetical protein
MAYIEIGQDGSVTVSERYINTFQDYRLPLHARMEKLALLVGSDAFEAEHRLSAECLLREAAIRLGQDKSADEKRQAVVNHMAQKANDLTSRAKYWEGEALYLTGYLRYVLNKLSELGAVDDYPEKRKPDDSWMDDYLEF